MCGVSFFIIIITQKNVEGLDFLFCYLHYFSCSAVCTNVRTFHSPLHIIICSFSSDVIL